MNKEDTEKQTVFNYWWGFELGSEESPKPDPQMLKAMGALYNVKKKENHNRSLEDMRRILPADIVYRVQELRDAFDKYTSGMKLEDKLEFIVGHIDGEEDGDEPAAKRRCR